MQMYILCNTIGNTESRDDADDSLKWSKPFNKSVIYTVICALS